MTMPIGRRKALAVLATAAGVFVLYVAVARPWFLNWGATDAEVSATLPGDDRVPRASLSTTRAITIDAPIDRVWPWLAQLGQDRGGFYSYEVLEDAVGCEMPHTSRILPEHQSWKPGDRLWMYPPRKLEGAGGAPLVDYRHGRHMVFATRQIGTPLSEPENGTWALVLEPRGERATRLITRGRAVGRMGALVAATHYAIFEPAHHVMERKMLLRIAALAEGRRDRSRASDNAEVALWVLTVGVLIASLVEVARRPRWRRPLVVAAAAALVFQILTLLQPPPFLGAAFVLALGLGLWGKLGDSSGREPVRSGHEVSSRPIESEARAEVAATAR